MQYLNAFTNLESLLSPMGYGVETPLGVKDQVSRGLNQKAFISQDCQWGYQYNQNEIRCFPVNTELGFDCRSFTGKKKSPLVLSTAKYTFTSQKSNSIKITSSAELIVHNQRLTSGIRKLLLGLDLGENGGALVIFDPLLGRPIKWISLPLPATCVTVISHFEKEIFRPFFNVAMLAMVGIAAVGLAGGQVLLVDLGLDDSSILHPPLDPFPSTSTSSIPKTTLMYVDPSEEHIATKRKTLFEKGQRHSICVSFIPDPPIDEEENMFSYLSPDKSLLGKVDKDEVYISAIEYFPQIGSLVIGYSFGAFQIWRIDRNTLIYSSAIFEDSQVLSFVFQQPIDDPKNFCYIWVLYGSASAELDDATAELYSLFYESKTYSEPIGFTYHELQKCNRRLTFKLEDIHAPLPEIQDSDVSKFLVRPIRMWAQSENLTCFAWETNRPEVYYIGIFDLNQWYSAQTIDILQISEHEELHPFWVAIKMETTGVNSNPWDVRIIPKSLERWESPYSQLDIHLYPASLTFSGVALTSTGTYAFEHFGIQEKLIRLLQENGYILMTEPSVLKNICCNFGLEPSVSIPYSNAISKETEDRYNIFTILMESKRSHVLIRMANKWMDGSFANAGLTIDCILEWIVNFSFGIRLLLEEEHWQSMFDARNSEISPETALMLKYSNNMWNSLKETLHILMINEVYESRHTFLDDLKTSLEMLVQFSTVILTIYKAGLLPESDEEDIHTPLIEFYRERRESVKNAIEASPFLEPEHKSEKALMIDHLLEEFDEEFLREQWNIEPHEAIYPPRHIGYILCMLLWPNHDPKAVSRVVFYYLLDINHLYEEAYQQKLQGDLSSMLNLSWEEQNEVYHLWMVDHGSFKETLGYMILNGGTSMNDTLPWDYLLIVLSAHNQKEHVKFLKRDSHLNLYKIYVNMMCVDEGGYSQLIQELFKSNYLKDPNLLLHFYKVIKRKGSIESFIKMHMADLDSAQIEILQEFLEKEETFGSDELLFHFFIKSKQIRRAEEHLNRMRIKWNDRGGTNRLKQIEKLAYFQKIVTCMQFLEKNEEKNPLRRFLSSNQIENGSSGPEKIGKVKIAQRSESTTSAVQDFQDMVRAQEEKSKRILRRSSCFSMSPLKHFEGNVYVDTRALNSPNGSRSSDDGVFSANLQNLLKTPRINHRKSLLKTPKTPPSAYHTPSLVTPHSILKTSNTPSKPTSHAPRVLIKDDSDVFDEASEDFADATEPSIEKSPEKSGEQSSSLEEEFGDAESMEIDDSKGEEVEKSVEEEVGSVPSQEDVVENSVPTPSPKILHKSPSPIPTPTPTRVLRSRTPKKAEPEVPESSKIGDIPEATEKDESKAVENPEQVKMPTPEPPSLKLKEASASPSNVPSSKSILPAPDPSFFVRSSKSPSPLRLLSPIAAMELEKSMNEARAYKSMAPVPLKIKEKKEEATTVEKVPEAPPETELRFMHTPSESVRSMRSRSRTPKKSGNDEVQTAEVLAPITEIAESPVKPIVKVEEAEERLKTPSPPKTRSQKAKTPSPQRSPIETPSPPPKVSSKMPSPTRRPSKTPSPVRKPSKTPSPARKPSKTPSPARKSATPSPTKRFTTLQDTTLEGDSDLEEEILEIYADSSIIDLASSPEAETPQRPSPTPKRSTPTPKKRATKTPKTPKKDDSGADPFTDEGSGKSKKGKSPKSSPAPSSPSRSLRSRTPKKDEQDVSQADITPPSPDKSKSTRKSASPARSLRSRTPKKMEELPPIDENMELFEDTAPEISDTSLIEESPPFVHRLRGKSRFRGYNFELSPIIEASRENLTMSTLETTQGATPRASTSRITRSSSRAKSIPPEEIQTSIDSKADKELPKSKKRSRKASQEEGHDESLVEVSPPRKRRGRSATKSPPPPTVLEKTIDKPKKVRKASSSVFIGDTIPDPIGTIKKAGKSVSNPEISVPPSLPPTISPAEGVKKKPRAKKASSSQQEDESLFEQSVLERSTVAPKKKGKGAAKLEQTFHEEPKTKRTRKLSSSSNLSTTSSAMFDLSGIEAPSGTKKRTRSTAGSQKDKDSPPEVLQDKKKRSRKNSSSSNVSSSAQASVSEDPPRYNLRHTRSSQDM